jgi:hypothetical protein
MPCARRMAFIATIGALVPACGGEMAEPSAAMPAVVSTVEITGGVEALTALGDTVRFVAVALDAEGNVMLGRTFTWASSDEAVVTVDASGLVTAVGIGRATVLATCENVSGSATVSVGPLGFVFVEQPSYSGDCGNKPAGSVCLAFSDGYVWLVYDAISGWAQHGYWDGRPIRSAIGFWAEYYHVLGTNLVFERSY